MRVAPSAELPPGAGPLEERGRALRSDGATDRWLWLLLLLLLLLCAVLVVLFLLARSRRRRAADGARPARRRVGR